jgi:hypothetical protein
VSDSFPILAAQALERAIAAAYDGVTRVCNDVPEVLAAVDDVECDFCVVSLGQRKAAAPVDVEIPLKHHASVSGVNIGKPVDGRVVPPCASDRNNMDVYAPMATKYPRIYPWSPSRPKPQEHMRSISNATHEEV